jgi:hypothetical protein
VTRCSRILVLLYALHSVWSAWCAVQQYLFGNFPVAGIFVLFTLVPAAAVIEQNKLTQLRDTVRRYEAREAMRRGSAAHEAQLKAAGLERVDVL